MKPIQYIIGDVTNPVGPGHKIIAHCCNDVGVMGAGVALAIATKWPAVKKEYMSLFQGATPCLGTVQLVGVDAEITVANIIGQIGIFNMVRLGRSIAPIRYEAIRDGFAYIAHVILKIAPLPKRSVHMPRIGCGLAGGFWSQIEPIVIKEFCEKDIEVTVYDLK